LAEPNVRPDSAALGTEKAGGITGGMIMIDVARCCCCVVVAAGARCIPESGFCSWGSMFAELAGGGTAAERRETTARRGGTSLPSSWCVLLFLLLLACGVVVVVVVAGWIADSE
jgi:hypothetical protein